jgi:hypothetical protein
MYKLLSNLMNDLANDYCGEKPKAIRNIVIAIVLAIGLNWVFYFFDMALKPTIATSIATTLLLLIIFSLLLVYKRKKKS